MWAIVAALYLIIGLVFGLGSAAEDETIWFKLFMVLGWPIAMIILYITILRGK